MDSPPRNTFDRFNNLTRYEQGVLAFNSRFFQILEWLLVAGALQFIGQKYDSGLTLAVAFVGTCVLSLHLSTLVVHSLMSLFPRLLNIHWSLATLLSIPVLASFYLAMRHVFEDIASHGV